MPIYQNNNQMGSVYEGANPISNVYGGSQRVFNNSYVPEDTYIDIEVLAADGTFTIPMSHLYAQGRTYDVVVSVNGEGHTRHTGICAPPEGSGIPVSVEAGITNRIVIEPYGRPVAGWGICFGFNGTTQQGANVYTNRYKITGVYNDPDFAHISSEDNILSGFRYTEYQACINLSFFNTGGSKINYNVITAGFWQSTFSGCTSLIMPAEEHVSDHCIFIGSSFRQNQYANCTSLKQTAEESLPVAISIDNIGINVRMSQYTGCTGLDVGEHIHTEHFAQLLNKNAGNYASMFYLPAQNMAPDTMPRYYTDSSRTTTAAVDTLTPLQRKQYVVNRMGIENYDSLNANWK